MKLVYFILLFLLGATIVCAWQENLFCSAGASCSYGDLFVNGTDDTKPYSQACVFSIYNSTNGLVVNSSMTNYSTGWQEYSISLATEGIYHYTINCSGSLVQGGLVYINETLTEKLDAAITNQSTILSAIQNTNSTIVAKTNLILANQTVIYDLILAVNQSIISHGDASWTGSGSGTSVAADELIKALYTKIETYAENNYGYPTNESWNMTNTSQVVTVIYGYDSDNLTIRNKTWSVS